jgi:ATP-dependent Clp protease adaptor protein ClpS
MTLKGGVRVAGALFRVDRQAVPLRGRARSVPRGVALRRARAIFCRVSMQQYPPSMAAGQNDDADGEGTGVGIATRTRTRTKKPTPYRVLMLNDDYTPMEFVVLCLQRFFRMNVEEATRVMLHVHQKGVGVCGVFSYEVAETKVTQVMDFARANQHPLQCTLEKA